MSCREKKKTLGALTEAALIQKTVTEVILIQVFYTVLALNELL